MKLSCHCGVVLTHELTRERRLFDLYNDALPAFNVGQYARSQDWLRRALNSEDFISEEGENGYFQKGDFFHVPRRIPRNRSDHGVEEDDVVELWVFEHNACIETLRYADDGTLTVFEHQSLPAGIAMPKRNVLASVVPPWPVEDYQKKWMEEHPDEQGSVPEWPEGSPFGGCCNWANLEFQCRCGALLGLLEIDCHQYKTVTFYHHATTLLI